MSDELNKEIRTLKMQIAKLQLESKLRRNLASELDKQKQIAKNYMTQSLVVKKKFQLKVKKNS